MKRSATIAMILLSPGMMLVALAMCCAFMGPAECHLQSDCHEEQTAVSGSCCAVFDGGPATATLHSAQFTLAPPGDLTTPAPVAQSEVAAAVAPVLAAVLDASPPALSLRI